MTNDRIYARFDRDDTQPKDWIVYLKTRDGMERVYESDYINAITFYRVCKELFDRDVIDRRYEDVLITHDGEDWEDVEDRQ